MKNTFINSTKVQAQVLVEDRNKRRLYERLLAAVLAVLLVGSVLPAYSQSCTGVTCNDCGTGSDCVAHVKQRTGYTGQVGTSLAQKASWVNTVSAWVASGYGWQVTSSIGEYAYYGHVRYVQYADATRVIATEGNAGSKIARRFDCSVSGIQSQTSTRHIGYVSLSRANLSVAVISPWFGRALSRDESIALNLVFRNQEPLASSIPAVRTSDNQLIRLTDSQLSYKGEFRVLAVPSSGNPAVLGHWTNRTVSPQADHQVQSTISRLGNLIPSAGRYTFAVEYRRSTFGSFSRWERVFTRAFDVVERSAPNNDLPCSALSLNAGTCSTSPQTVSFAGATRTPGLSGISGTKDVWVRFVNPSEPVYLEVKKQQGVDRVTVQYYQAGSCTLRDTDLFGSSNSDTRPENHVRTKISPNPRNSQAWIYARLVVRSDQNGTAGVVLRLASHVERPVGGCREDVASSVSEPGSDFELYPNPAPGGRFTVRLSGDKAATAQRLRIIDSQGRLIQEAALTEDGSSERSVDLQLAPGLYSVGVGDRWKKVIVP